MLDLDKEYRIRLGFKVYHLRKDRGFDSLRGMVDHADGSGEPIWWDFDGKALKWCLEGKPADEVNGGYDLIEVQDGRHEAAMKEQASEWLCHNDDVIIRKAIISRIERLGDTVEIYTLIDRGDTARNREHIWGIKCATDEDAQALMRRFEKELK